MTGARRFRVLSRVVAILLARGPSADRRALPRRLEPPPVASTEEIEAAKARREILLAEWQDVRESLRYFGNKRFAQITVFVAANGFLFNAVYKDNATVTRPEAAVAGIALAVLFFVLELGSVQFFERFAERGRAIEAELGDLKLMRYFRPRTDWATEAAYALYVFVGLAWVYVGWWPKIRALMSG
jgi:hypothetical protein